VVRTLGVGLAYASGLVVMLALEVLLGADPLRIFRTSMAFHLGHIDRPYWPWLILHTWDLGLFFGAPLLGLAILSLAGRPDDGLRQTAFAVALTLLAQVVSGTGRGETGRIWLFFMPLLLPGAALVLRELSFRARMAALVAQVFWLLVCVMVLRTVGTGLGPPPRWSEVAWAQPPTMTPVPEARFGPSLTLMGYHAEQSAAAERIVLYLQWRVEGQIAAPYYFSGLLVSPRGPQGEAVDWQPLAMRYPTTCWHLADDPGRIVDRVELPLEPGQSGGDWWISLSAFVLPPGGGPERLPVRAVNGEASDQIGLGPIAVVQP
jgi:hypothetical protein